MTAQVIGRLRQEITDNLDLANQRGMKRHVYLIGG